MSDGGRDGLWLGAVGVVAVLLTAVALWMWPADAPPEPEPEPADVANTTPPRAPKRTPTRPSIVHLPRPGLKEADLPGPRPEDPAKPMTVVDRAALNKAVNHSVRDAKLECLDPWIAGQLEGASAELVVNARVTDGELIDIELRTLAELPEDVVECVRDVLWDRDWPTADASGDVRFQETVEAVKR